MISVKELRRGTKMTQQAFADQFGIPVSTLRKWEQGEASPPAYVVRMMARCLPSDHQDRQKITGPDGQVYYISPERNSVMDDRGNEILIQEDLEGVKSSNLIIYLEDLFQDFHTIQDQFNRDCYFDKREDILWSRGPKGE